MSESQDFMQELTKFMHDIIPNLAHCKKLNISVVEVGDGQLTLQLPYSEAIIGNPETRVIHGGALTTLMDTASGFAAIAGLAKDGYALCPTLDLRIDYMRPATPEKTVMGHAETYRISSNVIFVRGIAYHEDEKDDPIAHCTSTFMRIQDPSVNTNLKEAE